MTDQTQDHANVVAFPPIILLATIALAIILDRFFPLGLLAKLPFAPRLAVGAILFLLGAATLIWTRLAFGKAGTSIRPDQPTTALVTSGLSPMCGTRSIKAPQSRSSALR